MYFPALLKYSIIQGPKKESCVMNDPEQVVGLWSPPKEICLEVQMSEKRDPETLTHTGMREVSWQPGFPVRKALPDAWNWRVATLKDVLAALEKEQQRCFIKTISSYHTLGTFNWPPTNRCHGAGGRDRTQLSTRSQDTGGASPISLVSSLMPDYSACKSLISWYGCELHTLPHTHRKRKVASPILPPSFLHRKWSP